MASGNFAQADQVAFLQLVLADDPPRFTHPHAPGDLREIAPLKAADMRAKKRLDEFLHLVTAFLFRLSQLAAVLFPCPR